MRERRKERQLQAVVARRYEAHGKAATERLSYPRAATYFKLALKYTTDGIDEARLFLHTGRALLYSARPDLATPWFEGALERFLGNTSMNGLAASVLVKLQSQCLFESRTADGLLYIDKIADLIGGTEPQNLRELTALGGIKIAALRYWPHLLRANIFNKLGRHSEALQALSTNLALPRNLREERGIYFRQLAIFHASEGCVKKMFVEFERSIELSGQISKGRIVAEAWEDFAIWAMELGRLDLARAYYERALFISRERRIIWRIPYSMLCLVSLLIKSRKYQRAKQLFDEAMTYDTETPLLHVLKTTVALELAQVMGDGNLLQRASNEKAIDLAIRSGEAPRISQTVAAFARVALAQRQTRRARNLISRGIAAIHNGNRTGELLSLAAQCGSPAEAERAKELLCARLRSPSHRVAQAYLHLWNVHSAIARGAQPEARSFAEKAASAFAKLGWRHQEVETLALVGRPREAEPQYREPREHPRVSGSLKALTKREQEVAELVLRGLSNRGIAQALSISEHTAESHVASILSRLGLRSRWQLTQFSRESPNQ